MVSPIRAIIFLGPPASGKGTQSEIIAEKIDAEYFRVSKIIQEKFLNFKDDPEVIQAKLYHDSGALIPPEILVKWTVTEIEKLLKNNKTIVFDGAFRTLHETEITFKTLIKYLTLNQIKVFFLDISFNTAIKRSAQRRICQSCSRPLPYNDKTKNLLNCPVCGGKLVKRMDEEKIHKRLEVYEKQTLPVLDFFYQKGVKVEKINGELSIEEITQEIMQKLQK
jgi:adenylate kinase